jgi:hypothetical protein
MSAEVVVASVAAAAAVTALYFNWRSARAAARAAKARRRSDRDPRQIQVDAAQPVRLGRHPARCVDGDHPVKPHRR